MTSWSLTKEPTVLTRAEVREIAERYHQADWPALPLDQIALDMGRLIGHAWHMHDIADALENQVAAAELAGDALEAALREARG